MPSYGSSKPVQANRKLPDSDDRYPPSFGVGALFLDIGNIRLKLIGITNASLGYWSHNLDVLPLPLYIALFEIKRE